MKKSVEHLDEVTIRFAGDSGDGMQLIGTQFSDTSGIVGNDVNTFPDYPSEIRAPEGTLYGVSAFQVHFGKKNINTAGDFIDVLVSMNASSLKVNLPNVKDNGIIIVNTNGFDAKNLKLAKFDSNPLENGDLSQYQVHAVDINEETKKELANEGLHPKVVKRTKNIFALGITYWLFNRPIEPTINWIKKKFKNKDDVINANVRVLRAGWNYAEKHPDLRKQYKIEKADLPPGTYRNITGNLAVTLGLVAAAKKANLPFFLGSYPITPATEILQYLSIYKKYGVKHLQAEDEIGGITSAIGASFGGSLAATTTSGPGLSLKVEALGLAVIAELPLIVIDVQRAGPSTGIPTKPEQGDLLQAIWGRHGEAPLVVLAAASASDCFNMTIEAARIALKYMTPVILLTDGYIGQATEPWKIPSLKDLPELKANFTTDKENFAPYKRDPETLARQWAIPGVPGLEHRIGGLEKQDITGVVSSEAENHQRMTDLRQQKIDNIANDIPLAEVTGDDSGELLLLSWGSTYGAAKTAFDKLREEGYNLSFVHLRYLNPMPKNLGEILDNFKRVFIPEMNMGQLKIIIQAKYLVPVLGLHKVKGIPFKAIEIEEKIVELLNEKEG